MGLPGLTTVTVILRVRRGDGAGGWARDSRGDAVYDVTRTDVPGCSVQPGGVGIESVGNGRDQVSTLSTIYAPLSWPGVATSAVEIAGAQYETVGEPQRWDSTPGLSHVVVQVRRTSG